MTAVWRQLASCNASGERTSPVKSALWGKWLAFLASDVTFVTVVAMFVWILADMAGDALEAWPTAAWAVAVDTVQALQGAGTSRNTKPIQCARLSVTYRSPVVAGVLESSDAGFTVWPIETLTALCNLRSTCTQTEALTDDDESNFRRSTFEVRSFTLLVIH